MLLSLAFISVHSFSEQDKKLFKQDLKLMKKDMPSLMDIEEVLDHPYFEKFYDYDPKKMGRGYYGIVFPGKMDLFETGNGPLLPVALKIFFRSVEGDWETIQRYLKMLIPEEDLETKNLESGEIDRVLETKSYFAKMYKGKVPSTTKIPFVGQIYEAAYIQIEDDDDEIMDVVCFAMQLGKKDWFSDFLSEDLQRNNLLAIQAMVKMSFGLAQMHGAGFLHGDLKLKNMMFADENLNPFIIDFDKTMSFQEMQEKGQGIRKEMFVQPADFTHLWKDPHCYVTYFGGLEKRWMVVSMGDLTRGLKNPVTGKPQFPRELDKIIPISPDLSEETIVLIAALLQFLELNGFALANNEKIPNARMKLDVSDELMGKVFDFLKTLDDQASSDSEFKMTSAQFYSNFSQVAGYQVDISKEVGDPLLLQYFGELKKKGFSGRKLISDEIKKSEILLNLNDVKEDKKKEKTIENNNRLIIV